MDRKVRISILWVLVILGAMVHSLVEMMPMFWGESVAALPKNEAQMHGMMVFSACFLMAIPMFSQLCVLYGAKRWAALANCVLAGLMLLLNTIHPMMDLVGAPLAQWIILPLEFVISLLLFIESIKLCRPAKSCCA